MAGEFNREGKYVVISGPLSDIRSTPVQSSQLSSHLASTSAEVRRHA